jgi:Cation efflux family
MARPLAEGHCRMSHLHRHPGGADRRRPLMIVLLLTCGCLIAEVVAGWLTHSLALLADAGHMLTDVAGLGLALTAMTFAARPRRPIVPTVITGSKVTVRSVAPAIRPAFDRSTKDPHPKNVKSLVQRAAAILCVMAFAHAGVIQCAGWQPTAEARRQCCRSGACPVQHHQQTGSGQALTQAAADTCCLSSPRNDSRPSSAFLTSVTLPPLTLVAFVVPAVVSASPVGPRWETPSPPAQVPRHLLLSVLLV